LEAKTQKLEPLGLKESERALSLLKAIPINRSCNEAGISTHWCACLKREEMIIDETVKLMAKGFVSYLNNKILGDHGDKCETISLHSVHKAYLLQSHIETQKKQDTSFKDKFSFVNLATPPPLEKNYKEFYFRIETNPGNAIYEFTMVSEMDTKLDLTTVTLETLFESLQISQSSISRINQYGDASKCIFQEFPFLRAYCYCKK
jgi:hypothetical protein